MKLTVESPITAASGSIKITSRAKALIFTMSKIGGLAECLNHLNDVKIGFKKVTDGMDETRIDETITLRGLAEIFAYAPINVISARQVEDEAIITFAVYLSPLGVLQFNAANYYIMSWSGNSFSIDINTDELGGVTNYETVVKPVRCMVEGTTIDTSEVSLVALPTSVIKAVEVFDQYGNMRTLTGSEIRFRAAQENPETYNVGGSVFAEGKTFDILNTSGVHRVRVYPNADVKVYTYKSISA